jgi:hypothetical protein
MKTDMVHVFSGGFSHIFLMFIQFHPQRRWGKPGKTDHLPSYWGLTGLTFKVIEIHALRLGKARRIAGHLGKGYWIGRLRTFVVCREARETQWEFKDPKIEVLHNIRPYSVVILTEI